MPTPVTTMTFDTSQELLWTGNDYVRRNCAYMTMRLLYETAV